MGCLKLKTNSIYKLWKAISVCLHDCRIHTVLKKIMPLQFHRVALLEVWSNSLVYRSGLWHRRAMCDASKDKTDQD